MTIHQQRDSERAAEPIVLHFSGLPEPWMGPYWLAAKYYSVYLAKRLAIDGGIGARKTVTSAQCVTASFRNTKSSIEAIFLTCKI